MIVLTKIQHWLSFKIQSWSFPTLLIVNYMLFGSIVYLLYKVGVSTHKELSKPLIVAFLLFYLSPRLAENHSWAFQSQFHFIIIFFLLNCLLLFRSGGPKWRDYILAGMGAFLAPISFSAAVPLMCVQWGVFFVHQITYRKIGLFKDKGFYLYTLGLVAGCLTYFSTYTPISGVQKTSPMKFEYWNYLVNFVGAGFGVDSEFFLLNFAVLIFVLLPLAFLLIRTFKKSLEDSSIARYLCLICGILVIPVLISWGRASLGVSLSKSGRYFEFAGMILIASFYGWQFVISQRSKTFQKYFNLAFWVFLFATFLNNWDHSKSYKYFMKRKAQGLACLSDGINKSDSLNCPTIYPGDIRSGVQKAKDLELNFIELLLQKKDRS